MALAWPSTRTAFVLDILVQSRRDKKAANRLFRKHLKKQGSSPRVLITDKLRSYSLPSGRSCPGSEHGSIRASITGPKLPSTDPTTRADQ